MEKSTFDRVTAIIVEHLGVDPGRMSEEAKLSTDLGADSLDEVELVMALEEEFGVEIPDDVAERLQDATVGKLVETVDKLLAGQPA